MVERRWFRVVLLLILLVLLLVLPFAHGLWPLPLSTNGWGSALAAAQIASEETKEKLEVEPVSAETGAKEPPLSADDPVNPKAISPPASAVLPADAADRQAAGSPPTGAAVQAMTETSSSKAAAHPVKKPPLPKTAAQPVKKPPPPKTAAPSAATETPSPKNYSPPPEPRALTYCWGSPHRLSFRTAVQLTNSGSEKAEHLWVDLPLLENSSPYQSNTLQGTNCPIDSRKGRIASFYLGTLAPGETKMITADYQVTIRPVSLSSTNDLVEKARRAYRQHAGSGNCRTLANRFVGSCSELGVTARVVNGFTRPQRAQLSPGPLKGCRHSWAEFYVDDLGWVPVDLTFSYFADFPYASHLIESYNDQAVRVNFLGGKVEVSWENAILP